MVGRVSQTWVGLRRPDWTVIVVESDSAAAAAAATCGGLAEPDLVKACLAGRQDAFDIIVERHRRAVYYLCYRFAGNHEDASDLSQEVFLRAYRGLKSFRGRSSLRTWLYRIGVNTCLNRGSGGVRSADPIDAEQLADQAADDPSAVLLRAESVARVRGAIARLPRTQRTTLILRMYHELSHREVASVLGSSVGATKANFCRALQNLKRLLATEAVKR